MTNHTPGPWTPEYIGCENRWTIETTKKVVSRINNLNSFEETKANARLIAAAPELLEALEGWAEFAKNNGYDYNWELFNDTKAAIKKAKGGA